jgi:hypothetical protein
MRNPFKRYGHIRTRYDEMRKLDNELKFSDWTCIAKFDSTITGIIQFKDNLIVSTTNALYTLKENPMYICGCGR